MKEGYGLMTKRFELKDLMYWMSWRKWISCSGSSSESPTVEKQTKYATHICAREALSLDISSSLDAIPGFLRGVVQSECFNTGPESTNDRFMGMNQIIFQKCVVLCEFPFLACLRFPGFDSEKGHGISREDLNGLCQFIDASRNWGDNSFLQYGISYASAR